MSRGPGALQVRVMEILKIYHELGASLEWRWHNGGSRMRQYAKEESIERYERADLVPVWILLRDLTVAKPLLSRALHGLRNMGYVLLYGPALGMVNGIWPPGQNAKFATLTRDGKRWLSDNKVKLTKLSLNPENRPPSRTL